MSSLSSSSLSAAGSINNNNTTNLLSSLRHDRESADLEYETDSLLLLEPQTKEEQELQQQEEKPKIALPVSFMILLFSVSAAQSMSSSLLTLLFAKTLEPQQTTYFWTYMSWIYWCAPVSGWVSDICGNRKILLLLGLILNVGAWSLITWEAGDSFAMFVVYGAFQNASMLFVNAAINGALVEVVKSFEEVTKKSSTPRTLSSSSSNATSNLSIVQIPSAASQQQRQENTNANDDDDKENNTQKETTFLIQENQQPEVEHQEEEEEVETEQQRNDGKKANPQSMLSKSGDTQSTAMIARSLGSVLGAVVQTFALVKMEIRSALAISIGLYGASAIVAVFADFSHKSNSKQKKKSIQTESFFSRIQSVFKRLRQLCDTKTGKGKEQRSAAIDVVLLLAFIFCNNMLPDATSFYQSYVFDAFSYPNWFNSTYQLGNLLGALIACEVYRRFFAKLSQTKVFVAGCFFAATSYLTGLAFCTGFTNEKLHISNAVYLMFDTFVVGFLNRLAFMPILHVASVRCPKGFEAVVFELFSLAAIGGSTVANLIAIRIANTLEISRTNWDQLWILMVIASASRILPIFVVPHLPPPPAEKKVEEIEQGEKEEEK